MEQDYLSTIKKNIISLSLYFSTVSCPYFSYCYKSIYFSILIINPLIKCIIFYTFIELTPLNLSMLYFY